MTSPRSTTTPSPANLAGLIIGGLCLVLSLGASIALAQQHLGGWDLPGCGGDSPCAQLGDSFWGKLPGTEWPISFVGAAYFAGMLLALLMTGGRLTKELRWLARLGVALSVLYSSIMLTEGLLCGYCAAAHIANALFWLTVEFSSRPKTSHAAPILAMLGAFAALSIGFGVLENAKKASIEAQNQATIETIATQSDPNQAAQTPSESSSETSPLVEKPSTNAVDPTDNSEPVAQANAADQAAQPEHAENPADTTASADNTNNEDDTNSEVTNDTTWTRPEIFTGRRHLGPDKALLRIVSFGDFQCKSCKMVEKEFEALIEKYPDAINFSMKHFPMGMACNPYAGRNIHPNACWAARAAEAAAILHGDEGYWEFHRWLFERGGSFTSDELSAQLDELGWDRTEFTNVLTGDETMARVQADIREGYEYGLISTPMIFINGVEFKGWNVKNGVTRAIDQLVPRLRQMNKQPGDAANDRPPLANQKFVNDFKRRHVLTIDPDTHPRTRGPEDALLNVIVWGDYQERLARVACQAIEKYAAQHGNLRFSWRNFPVNSDCNPHMKVPTKQPLACRMARAAEIVGAQGGDEAYWALHEWLLANQKTFTDDSLREFVTSIELDADALFQALDDPNAPEVQAADANIVEDIEAALKLGIRAVPMININGRTVGAWQRKGDPAPLYMILDVANQMAKQTSATPKKQEQ